MKLLQQCFLFFIVVVIPGHNLGNSQVSDNRTIGPTLVIIYPLNGYFTIDSAPIYNIQDHPAFHFALVNVKTIISSALAGYSCSPEPPPFGAKW